MDITIIQNPLVKSFLAGSLSGTCSIVLFQPLDLMKTRIQTATSVTIPTFSSQNGIITVKPNMRNVLRSVVLNESISGLWRGFVPSFLRCVPGVGMYFMTLHGVKEKYYENRKLTSLESVAVGATARTITTACMLPMTVIKTRYESGIFNYQSIKDALVNIHRNEGARGFYRGISATLLRDAPFSGLYLMVYSNMKDYTSEQEVVNESVNTFLCGLIAGCFASFITQPADVIKTRMQVNKTSQSMTEVISNIYKEQGTKGFLRGIMPRLTRRTLMASMAWTVYEQVGKKLKL